MLIIVNLHGYYSKLVNLHNYIHVLMGVIFKQNYVNSTFFFFYYTQIDVNALK